MARVASLLEPYYDKDTPVGIKKMNAEDWAVELEGVPRWAVDKAVRWWKGRDNKTKRHRQPVEGDIRERADIEMGVVRAAQMYLDRPAVLDDGDDDSGRDRTPLTDEQRAEFQENLARFVRQVKDQGDDDGTKGRHRGDGEAPAERDAEGVVCGDGGADTSGDPPADRPECKRKRSRAKK